ncbi:MAG: recombinase family protein, partial [Alphaproteobacteria bacterium]|nr:recombinase family protein [Alphaproteobacteria bacterium]
MTGKIQSQHLTKQAYIYLRQSTMAQVRCNQESTQRQYALQDKAQQLGWAPALIKILDGDLGISGAQSSNREDFKTLVADVSMGQVGAIFVLEASRLSRSCADWHRVLELCAMTNTLIIDEDGCYNPCEFNDQLLLNLKGSMSFAELHFIRARLQGGKINKAKKGELKFSLPAGFCHDENNRVRLDSDEQVRNSLRLFFNAFKEKGSAYGVVRHFAQHHIQFPKRAFGGILKGKLIWGKLSHSRTISVLKNPVYAGVYGYGRRTSQKKL